MEYRRDVQVSICRLRSLGLTQKRLFLFWVSSNIFDTRNINHAHVFFFFFIFLEAPLVDVFIYLRLSAECGQEGTLKHLENVCVLSGVLLF